VVKRQAVVYSLYARREIKSIMDMPDTTRWWWVCKCLILSQILDIVERINDRLRFLSSQATTRVRRVLWEWWWLLPVFSSKKRLQTHVSTACKILYCIHIHSYKLQHSTLICRVLVLYAV
jgi:hypothetical protein